MLHKAMPFKTMEAILASKLKDCELWSDLHLTEEEYDILTEKIRFGIPTTNRYKGYLSFLTAYPVCAVTQIVYFTVYHYQDEFWTPWAQALDFEFDPAYTRSIGSKVIAAFQLHGFRYDEDGYKYITPIMCQAGIPYAHLDDLFDAVYAENRMTIDAEALVRDLSGWKSYMLHRPVQRFIREYPAKAANLLADANDLVQSEVASLCIDEDCDPVMVKKFDEWKQHSDEHERIRRKQQGYPVPVLSFSDDGRGVCLRLPSVTAKDEYISYFRWLITVEDSVNIMEIPCKLLKDANRLYSREQLISVTPAASYFVQLYDDIDNRPLVERTIPGFQDASFAVFDNKGRRVTDDYLPATEAYLVAKRDVCTVAVENCNTAETPLPANCSGWEATLIAPENQRAVLNVSDGRLSKTLRMRSSIHTELLGDRFLFDQLPYGGNLALYTELPKLRIWLDEDAATRELSVRIRLRQTGERVVLEEAGTFSGSRCIDFTEYFTQAGFGIYDIRIYEKKYLRKNLMFAYVPHVPFTFANLHPWPTQYSNSNRTGFEYQITDQAEIDIADNVGRDLIHRSGQNWAVLSLDIPITEIKGRITFQTPGGQLTLPWVKRVRNFTWSIWKEGDTALSNCHETQMLTDVDLEAGKYWLSMWINRDYIDDALQIRLVGKGKQIKQVMSTNLSAQGRCTLPLDAFSDTLQETVLPVDIVAQFCTGGENYEVVLAHISEAVILPKLKYRVSKETGSAELSWSTEAQFPEGLVTIKGITEPDFQQDLDLSGLVPNESNTRWTKKLGFTMKPGLYKLEQAAEDDFFFDDNGYRPPKLQQENILTVEVASLGTAAQKYASAFLKFCIYNAGSLENLDKLERYISRNHTQMVNDIDESACRIMTCILINYAEESDEISRKMIRLLELVVESFVSGAMRTQLLKWILDYDLSSTQKKTCFRILNLYLADRNEAVDLTASDIEQLMHIAPEFGLLWMLRIDRPVGLYNKLCATVGRDALKTMILFPDSDASWERSVQDLLAGKGSGAEIRLNKNLVGRSAQFHEMFAWGSRNELPHLEMKRRPENGIYFCGQTYCDLLIYWYLKNRRAGIYDTDFKALFARAYAEMDQLVNQFRKSRFDIIGEIVRAAESRRINRSYDGFFPLFYYSCIAVLLQTMVFHDQIDPAQCKNTMQFLRHMMKQFPELIKRDMLMCELLIYLDGRK